MEAKEIIAMAALALICGAAGYGLGGNREVDDLTASPTPPAIAREQLRAGGLPDRVSLQVRTAVEEGAAALSLGDVRGAFSALKNIEKHAERQQGLFELIGRLEADQLAEAFELMDGKPWEPDDTRDENILGVRIAFIDHWLEVDAEAAMSHALGSASEGFRGEMIASMTVTMLASKDPAMARQLLETARRENPDTDVADDELIYCGLALSDPAAAMRGFLAAVGDDPEALEDHAEAIVSFSGSRVDEALEVVVQMPAGEGRFVLLTELFGVWSKSNPQAALKAALDLPEMGKHDQFMGRLLSNVAQVDPTAALAALDQFPEADRRELEFEVFAGWASRDVMAALRWGREALDAEIFGNVIAKMEGALSPEVVVEQVAGMSAESQGQFFDQLRIWDDSCFIHRLAAIDAGEAVDWLNANGLIGESFGEPRSPKQRGAGEQIAQAAMRQGFEEAAALAAALPEGLFREGFVESLAESAGETDPAAASAWATQLEGAEREAAFDAVARGWARVEPVAAAKWALAQGSEVAIESALASWEFYDAEGAYRWLVGEFADQPTRVDELVRDLKLLETWAEQDPSAAAVAATGFPADLAAGHVAEVTGLWAANEPEAAGRFIDEQLEPGAVRDAAVKALIGKIRTSDVNAAMAWARTISDEATMYSVLDSLATE